MNFSSVIQSISSALNVARIKLQPIPGLLMLCTSGRRPGLSSILASAKIFSEMNESEFDDVLKKFIYNLVDKIKLGIQDDAVCLIVIPPGELKYTLTGGNVFGPVILNENPMDATKLPSNPNYVVCWGIIR